MREIKFRAWDKKIKVILDSQYGDWISFDGVPYTEAEKIYNTPNIEIQKEGNYEIMQYTGLKDKTGREIYEGDILKWIDVTSNYPNKTEHIEAVIVVSLNRMTPFLFARNTFKDDSHFYEVIGNIYENPEML